MCVTVASKLQHMCLFRSSCNWPDATDCLENPHIGMCVKTVSNCVIFICLDLQPAWRNRLHRGPERWGVHKNCVKVRHLCLFRSATGLRRRTALRTQTHRSVRQNRVKLRHIYLFRSATGLTQRTASKTRTPPFPRLRHPTDIQLKSGKQINLGKAHIKKWFLVVGPLRV